MGNTREMVHKVYRKIEGQRYSVQFLLRLLHIRIKTLVSKIRSGTNRWGHLNKPDSNCLFRSMQVRKGFVYNQQNNQGVQISVRIHWLNKNKNIYIYIHYAPSLR